MYKAGLLILTQPLSKSRRQIPAILDEISKLIKETLYVHIQPNTKKLNPAEWTVNRIPCTKEIQIYIREFYSSSASRCMTLDVRVLLGHISNIQSNFNSVKHQLSKGYDAVLLDNHENHDVNTCGKILEKVTEMYPVDNQSLPVIQLKDSVVGASSTDINTESETLKTYDFVALGGTFDRLHSGHKVLLNEGCLLCDKRLTVGVSEKELNKKKILKELLEPVEERKKSVIEFIRDIRPQIEPNVVSIQDVYGPTITDTSLQLIVLSEETIKGGAMINEERKNRSMPKLDEVVINLIEDPCHVMSEDVKVSSSSLRRRLLGTLIRPVQSSDVLYPPYRIGLTGGICSGKSSICKKLEKLGAGIINCDKLGHKTYEKGTEAYQSIIKTFGKDILTENGDIDRKKLGGIVFSDQNQLKKLNGIVWPEIAMLAEQQIQHYKEEGKQVVILDAAVLLEADWNEMVHEVWTAVIPESEAVSRIKERNGLTEEEAEKRVHSQMSNEDRVKKSNVIFCSLWEYEYTQSQVNKAWRLLQQRIKDVSKL